MSAHMADIPSLDAVLASLEKDEADEAGGIVCQPLEDQETSSSSEDKCLCEEAAGLSKPMLDLVLNPEGGGGPDLVRAHVSWRHRQCHVAVEPSTSIEDATEIKSLGVKALQEKRYQEASDLFMRAAALNPTDMMVQNFADTADLYLWRQQGVPVFRMTDHTSAEKLAEAYLHPAAYLQEEGIKALEEGESYKACDRFMGAIAALGPEGALGTTAQRLMQLEKLKEWDAKGYPVFSLADFDQAQKLVKDMQSVELMGLAELQQWYKSFQYPSESIPREDLVELRTKTMVWEELPLHELQREARRCRIPAEAGAAGEADAAAAASLPVSRQQLIQRLLLHHRLDAWERAGYPVRRVGGQSNAFLLVAECERINHCSDSELLNWYVQLGFLEERNLQVESVRKLMQRVVGWQMLPTKELRRECWLYHINLDYDDDDDEEVENNRPDILDKLLAADRMQAWERQWKVPVTRLPNIKMAIHLVKTLEPYESMTTEQLLESFQSLGFPVLGPMGHDTLLRICKEAAFLHLLPADELACECEIKGLPSEVWKAREEDKADVQSYGKRMMERLLLETVRELWESFDFPVRSFSSTDKLLQAANLWAEADAKSQQEMYGWYETTNLTLESDMDDAEIRRVMKAISLWEFLPLKVLAEKCKQQNLPVAPADLQLAEVEHAIDTDQGTVEQTRLRLTLELLLADRMEAWERRGFEARSLGAAEVVQYVVRDYELYKQMPEAELRSKLDEEANLPAAGTVSIEILLFLVKKSLVWERLPTAELERLCTDRGVPITCQRMDRDQRHLVLVHRLRVDLFITLASSLAPASSSGETCAKRGASAPGEDLMDWYNSSEDTSAGCDQVAFAFVQWTKSRAKKDYDLITLFVAELHRKGIMTESLPEPYTQEWVAILKSMGIENVMDRMKLSSNWRGFQDPTSHTSSLTSLASGLRSQGQAAAVARGPGATGAGGSKFATAAAGATAYASSESEADDQDDDDIIVDLQKQSDAENLQSILLAPGEALDID